MLAGEINPRAAMANLRRLEKDGALGAYGYYEAIDYTPERLPQRQRHVLIRAFMTHHQGMSLVALNNVLHDDRMENRFHADPLVQATELLLQERIPVGVPAPSARGRSLDRSGGANAAGNDHARLPPRRYRDAADTVAVEWNLQRHGHGRWQRLFQLRRQCGDALARRCHAR